MNLRRSLALLWQELIALFPERDARFWFLMAAAALLQAGFWYLASPGPALLEFEPRNQLYALKNVGLTVVFLLLLPFVLTRSVGVRLPEAGLRLGNARFALPLVGVLWLLVLIPLFAAGATAPFQATYPWPGLWAGESVANLVTWGVTYGLYYLAFEYFYRGFLLRVAAERFGLGAGIWLQALAATLIHLGRPLPQLLIALPLGLVLGVLAVRGRTLLYPVLLHWLIGISTDIFTLYHLDALPK